MDIGIIASRYAKALLKYACSEHQEATVYQEMQTLAQACIDCPRLPAAMKNPVVTAKQKVALLQQAAQSKGKLSTTTARFLALVVDQRRADMAGFIAHAFISQYCQYRHITPARLTTAAPMPQQLTDKMRQLVERRTTGTVEFDTTIDNNIGGGFILRYGTYQLDASIRTQLDKLHQGLTH